MWKALASSEELDVIKQSSFTRPQVIYKHSTRCVLSSMVKTRLQQKTLPKHIDFYELDLIANRKLSNDIAEQFHVHHESPQVIVVVNGDAIFDNSHMSIRLEEVIEQAESVKPIQA